MINHRYVELNKKDLSLSQENPLKLVLRPVKSDLNELLIYTAEKDGQKLGIAFLRKGRRKKSAGK